MFSSAPLILIRRNVLSIRVMGTISQPVSNCIIWPNETGPHMILRIICLILGECLNVISFVTYKLIHFCQYSPVLRTWACARRSYPASSSRGPSYITSGLLPPILLFEACRPTKKQLKHAFKCGDIMFVWGFHTLYLQPNMMVSAGTPSDCKCYTYIYITPLLGVYIMICLFLAFLSKLCIKQYNFL